METVDKVVERFKSKKLKITPQRLGIFEILEGNTAHLSAEDVFKEIRKSYPTISFTTVYKTLEIMEKMGEIMKITIDEERKHYDPNTDSHHHIICLRCSKISDIKDGSIKPKLPREILDEFTPSSYHISFYGTCKKCR
ncbi:MAG: transcriptional repressor [Candidatus Scalindua sediminis]|nr:transcriptional repressor [Candidatus Scalindua sediminis]HDY69051.1 transcriptional repressor [Candidatus Scalindua sp.]